MRRTKIVCTVGPATRDPRVVRQLVSLVDVFRINFSHGVRAEHLEEIKTIRKEAKEAGRTVAILQDLPGPKIRVGKIAGGTVELIRGSLVTLTSDEVEGDATTIPVGSQELLSTVKKGDVLHLADGLIGLRVEDRKDEDVRCEVIVGGTLSSGKGVNAPGVALKIEYPTPADISHLKFGIAQRLDFIAMSFVRTASDVASVRRLVPKEGPRLIAKIEKKEAVKNFESILAESDGAMVARGDLGIEGKIETVPIIQKRIISRCNQEGKPVIVATQMLMSMVSLPVPTRAEVSDVSTAILDGTDAVMLSDETTVGMYPVEAVRMLDRIARSTEEASPDQSLSVTVPSDRTEEAIAKAACQLAEYVRAKAIVAPTQTGSTARRVAMFRPSRPIVALCTDPRIARTMKLYKGVVPMLSTPAGTMDRIFEKADQAAIKLGVASPGDKIVVTSGTPGMKGTTNLIKVSVVGSRA
jgi:pyruvate kinase